MKSSKTLLFSLGIVFLLIFSSILFYHHSAQADEVAVCEIGESICYIQPGQEMIFKIDEAWTAIDPSLRSYKVVNEGSNTIMVPSLTADEWNSFIFNYPFKFTVLDPAAGDDQKDVVLDEAQVETVCSLSSPGTKTYGDSNFNLSYNDDDSDGTLSFQSSNTNIATVDNNGQVNIQGAGTVTITMNLSETSNYSACSDSTTFTINKADQSTVTTGGCSSTTWGTNCTVSASGGSGTGVYEFDQVSGPCSINSSTGIVSSTAAGTCEVRARRLGDDNYKNSDYSSTRSITLNKQDQSSVSGDIALSLGDYSLNPNVTASGGSGTGDYEFNQSSGTGSVSFSGSGSSQTLTPNSEGTVYLQVRRLGDDDYYDSSWATINSGQHFQVFEPWFIDNLAIALLDAIDDEMLNIFDE